VEKVQLKNFFGRRSRRRKSPKIKLEKLYLLCTPDVMKQGK